MKINIKSNKIKKTSAAIFAALLLFVGTACSKSPIMTDPPPLEEVKGEFISLIEASVEINDILFGEGLPVYKRDGSDEDKQIYVDMTEYLDGYEVVRQESKYLTIDEMKISAEKVYSKEYLEPIYEMVFVGYADDISGVTTAKYIEWDSWLYKSMSYEPFITSARTYDYDTMEMITPSSEDFVNIEIESSLGDVKTTVILSFTLTDNGWRLDTPTY